MTPILPATVTVRPATAGDRALLRDVYASTRAEELDQVSWAPGQREAFVQMQFDAQHHEYRRHDPHGDFAVIEVAGVATGRLYVARRPGELRIIDIALLPDHRGRGIGTSLVTGLLRQAEAEGRRVVIHVEARNPARLFYERLGFRVAEDLGVYQRMEWSC